MRRLTTIVADATTNAIGTQGYLEGNTPALMCAYDFFGADHMVFATDSPYDDEMGERVYRETIPAVDAMTVSADDKRKIFEGNARRLFRL